ncbi:hypothetical protein [Pseudoxanthomonas sp. UTMC 1351]|uniref:hypothetical protein n=1 Tax=Pseudoxanthomonas sp. UTMC 1351 TaxID=2695853 RepID=UPI0034CF9068
MGNGLDDCEREVEGFADVADAACADASGNVSVAVFAISIAGFGAAPQADSAMAAAAMLARRVILRGNISGLLLWLIAIDLHLAISYQVFVKSNNPVIPAHAGTQRLTFRMVATLAN